MKKQKNQNKQLEKSANRMKIACIATAAVFVVIVIIFDNYIFRRTMYLQYFRSFTRYISINAVVVLGCFSDIIVRRFKKNNGKPDIISVIPIVITVLFVFVAVAYMRFVVNNINMYFPDIYS